MLHLPPLLSFVLHHMSAVCIASYLDNGQLQSHFWNVSNILNYCVKLIQNRIKAKIYIWSWNPWCIFNTCIYFIRISKLTQLTGQARRYTVHQVTFLGDMSCCRQSWYGSVGQDHLFLSDYIIVCLPANQTSPSFISRTKLTEKLN